MTRNVSILLAALFFGGAAGCAMSQAKAGRDLNSVFASHSGELMAKPGVAGVYLGLMPNQKTECIRVMLKEDRPEIRRSIPKKIEGFPVLVEVSGEIRPLTKN